MHSKMYSPLSIIQDTETPVISKFEAVMATLEGGEAALLVVWYGRDFYCGDELIESRRSYSRTTKPLRQHDCASGKLVAPLGN